jgi:hypothetical protein
MLILGIIRMKPLKIRSSFNNEKIKTLIPSNSPISVKISSQTYVDYTNFQDGFVMVFDEERNRLHFISPDELLSNTYQQQFPPEVFSDEITNQVNQRLDIDLGKY